MNTLDFTKQIVYKLQTVLVILFNVIYEMYVDSEEMYIHVLCSNLVQIHF